MKSYEMAEIYFRKKYENILKMMQFHFLLRHGSFSHR